MVDRPGIWNIQAEDLAKGLILVPEGLPHITSQVVYIREEIHRLAGWGSAWKIWTAYLTQTSGALDYGFVLHPPPPKKTAITDAQTDILCESPLLRWVHQLMYLPPVKPVLSG